MTTETRQLIKDTEALLRKTKGKLRLVNPPPDLQPVYWWVIKDTIRGGAGSTDLLRRPQPE